MQWSVSLSPCLFIFLCSLHRSRIVVHSSWQSFRAHIFNGDHVSAVQHVNWRRAASPEQSCVLPDFVFQGWVQQQSPWVIAGPAISSIHLWFKASKKRKTERSLAFGLITLHSKQILLSKLKTEYYQKQCASWDSCLLVEAHVPTVVHIQPCHRQWSHSSTFNHPQLALLVSEDGKQSCPKILGVTHNARSDESRLSTHHCVLDGAWRQPVCKYEVGLKLRT